MSNQSIIEHKANMYYVEFQEDFLLICQQMTYKKSPKTKASPYCKALILAILEHWTNTKRDNRQPLSVYMSYSQWHRAMFGMFGRNVIIDSIDELLGEEIVTRSTYKMFGRDSFQYILNFQEVNRRIHALPEREPDTLLPDLFTSKQVEEPDTIPADDVTRLQVTATRLQVTATRLLVNATRPKVNADPFTSNHNLDTTHIHPHTTEILPRESSILLTIQSSNHNDAIASTPSQQIVSSSSKGKQKITPLPITVPEEITEPSMSGPWDCEVVVQYAEWCNRETHHNKRYSDKARKKELDAARAMHQEDDTLTLEQFKAAFDARNDTWWHEHVGLLHVHHLKEKDRIHACLDKVQASKAIQGKPEKVAYAGNQRKPDVYATIDMSSYGSSSKAQSLREKYLAR